MIQSMKSIVLFAENYSLRQMKGFTANNDIPREVLMMENILSGADSRKGVPGVRPP